jgi:hypothetical protein
VAIPKWHNSPSFKSKENKKAAASKALFRC